MEDVPCLLSELPRKRKGNAGHWIITVFKNIKTLEKKKVVAICTMCPAPAPLRTGPGPIQSKRIDPTVDVELH